MSWRASASEMASSHVPTAKAECDSSGGLAPVGSMPSRSEHPTIMRTATEQAARTYRATLDVAHLDVPRSSVAGCWFCLSDIRNLSLGLGELPHWRSTLAFKARS